MNGNLRDKHLLVGLFVFLCFILIFASIMARGWDKLLDWSLDKAALVLGGILTLLVQRAVGANERSSDGGRNVTPKPLDNPTDVPRSSPGSVPTN